MTKLPDNDTLRELYQKGLSDKSIAQRYGVTVQAVNWRLARMGIRRMPYSFMATEILQAAYPTSVGFRRSHYTQLNRGRELFSFIRWRLGDPTLSERQLHMAKRFAEYSHERNVVVSLDVSAEVPWVWLPRVSSDGRLVIRWPAGQERPGAAHLQAITLPEPRADEAAAATPLDVWPFAGGPLLIPFPPSAPQEGIH
ncbi:ImmA/IrrE family metallo-endopeptidase [Streptomyces sp. NPDC054847]